MSVFSKVTPTPDDAPTYVVHPVAFVLQVVLQLCNMILGLPIVAGQYVLCHLPNPHGSVFAAAGIDRGQIIGRNGGLFIAAVAAAVIVVQSFRHYRHYKKHTRIGVIILPAPPRIWKYLNTRGGSLTLQTVCMLQGVAGAYVQEHDDEATDVCLDVVQAGFAGAIGALLFQVVFACINYFVERARKTTSLNLVVERGKVGPSLRGRPARQARQSVP